MPILSPDEVVPVVLVVPVVPLFEFPAAILVLLVSVLLQPIRIATQSTQRTKKVFLNIGVTPSGFSQFPERKQSRLEKRRYDTRADREIDNFLGGITVSQLPSDRNSSGSTIFPAIAEAATT